VLTLYSLIDNRRPDLSHTETSRTHVWYLLLRDGLLYLFSFLEFFVRKGRPTSGGKSKDLVPVSPTFWRFLRIWQLPT